MSISVGKYTFEGPYTRTNDLENRSGVYAIHCRKKNYLLDVGESAKVKERIENHDRKNCWTRNCAGTVTVSVLYTPNHRQSGRMAIEQEIRNQYNPPCGER